MNATNLEERHVAHCLAVDGQRNFSLFEGISIDTAQYGTLNCVYDTDRVHLAMRTIYYIALLSAACLLCMSVGFAVVRATHNDRGSLIEAEAAETVSAEAAADLSSQLAQLMSAYLEHVRAREMAGEQAFEQWVAERFRPALSELTSRVEAAHLPPRADAAMSQALSRMAEMAAEPDSAELRVVATDQVLEASTILDASLAMSIESGND